MNSEMRYGVVGSVLESGNMNEYNKKEKRDGRMIVFYYFAADCDEQR